MADAEWEAVARINVEAGNLPQVEAEAEAIANRVRESARSASSTGQQFDARALLAGYERILQQAVENLSNLGKDLDLQGLVTRVHEVFETAIRDIEQSITESVEGLTGTAATAGATARRRGPGGRFRKATDEERRQDEERQRQRPQVNVAYAPPRVRDEATAASRAQGVIQREQRRAADQRTRDLYRATQIGVLNPEQYEPDRLRYAIGRYQRARGQGISTEGLDLPEVEAALRSLAEAARQAANAEREAARGGGTPQGHVLHDILGGGVAGIGGYRSASRLPPGALEGSAFGALGRGLLGGASFNLFFALQGGIMNAVGAAVQLDKQLAGLQSEVQQVGQGGQFNQLRQSIFGISDATGVAGADVAQLSDIFFGLTQNIDQTIQATKAAAQFIEVTGESAAQAGPQIATIMQNFGISGPQAGNAAVAAAQAAGRGSPTGIAGVQAGVAAIAPVASLLGLSANQSYGLIAAASRGSALGGADIGSGLDRILENLQTQLPTLGAYGVKLPQGGNIQQDFIALVQQWQKLPQQNQIGIANALGGQRNAQVLEALQRNPQALGLLQGNYTGSDALQQRAAAVTQTAAQSLKELTTSAETFAETLVNAGLGAALSDLAHSAEVVLKALGEMATFVVRVNDDLGGLPGRLVEFAAAVAITKRVAPVAVRAGGDILDRIRGVPKPVKESPEEAARGKSTETIAAETTERQESVTWLQKFWQALLQSTSALQANATATAEDASAMTADAATTSADAATMSADAAATSADAAAKAAGAVAGAAEDVAGAAAGASGLGAGGLLGLGGIAAPAIIGGALGYSLVSFLDKFSASPNYQNLGLALGTDAAIKAKIGPQTGPPVEPGAATITRLGQTPGPGPGLSPTDAAYYQRHPEAAGLTPEQRRAGWYVGTNGQIVAPTTGGSLVPDAHGNIHTASGTFRVAGGTIQQSPLTPAQIAAGYRETAAGITRVLPQGLRAAAGATAPPTGNLATNPSAPGLPANTSFQDISSIQTALQAGAINFSQALQDMTEVISATHDPIAQFQAELQRAALLSQQSVAVVQGVASYGQTVGGLSPSALLGRTAGAFQGQTKLQDSDIVSLGQTIAQQVSAANDYLLQNIGFSGGGTNLQAALQTLVSGQGQTVPGAAAQRVNQALERQYNLTPQQLAAQGLGFTIQGGVGTSNLSPQQLQTGASQLVSLQQGIAQRQVAQAQARQATQAQLDAIQTQSDQQVLAFLQKEQQAHPNVNLQPQILQAQTALAQQQYQAQQTALQNIEAQGQYTQALQFQNPLQQAQTAANTAAQKAQSLGTTIQQLVSQANAKGLSSLSPQEQQIVQSWAQAQQQIFQGIQSNTQAEISYLQSINLAAPLQGAQAAVTALQGEIQKQFGSIANAQAQAAAGNPAAQQDIANLNQAAFTAFQASQANVTGYFNAQASAAAAAGNTVQASQLQVQAAQAAVSAFQQAFPADANLQNSQYSQLVQQLNQAKQSALQAQLNQIQALGQLQASQFAITGNAPAAAQAAVTAARNALNAFKAQFPNQASNTNSTWVQLMTQYNQAVANALETTISFNENLIQEQVTNNQISIGQAIQKLRVLQQQAQAAGNFSEVEQIQTQIQQFINQGNENAAFNLPSNLNLPTLYEVRRTEGTPTGANYYGNTGTVNVNINIGSNVDTGSAINQLMAAVGGPPTTGLNLPTS